MSKKRDFARSRRRHLVVERGAAAAVPKAKPADARWDTLAEERGWTRPEVKDWRQEMQLPRG